MLLVLIRSASVKQVLWITRENDPRIIIYQQILLNPLSANNNCSRRQFFNFLFIYFTKTSLDISCESSAWQTIHMKCQDLFSLKNNKKNFECRLLQILLGALRVNKSSDITKVTPKNITRYTNASVAQRFNYPENYHSKPTPTISEAISSQKSYQFFCFCLYHSGHIQQMTNW